MTIQAGQMLLHYRLVEKIGEGGMGVVWKATDTKLDREVAIKILPGLIGDSGDRLARFEREAKLLASLNHANIASIFGLHETDGVNFLAMELVPGEDLSKRLAPGALPVDQALEIARQVAEALETAHANGVVHRDLKPANIQLTPEGKVKVLDFGLAKAFEVDQSASGANPALSPTLTSAGTTPGMILGTASYMSPEQARGQAADKRADVWAFGCVLYEMLCGAKPFKGDTVSDTLASVLKVDPAWDSLTATVPRRIRTLLGRCLQKDARQRLHDIADARIVIEETLSGVPDEEEASAAPAASRKRERLIWAALLVVAVGVGIALGLMGGGATELPLRKLALGIDGYQYNFTSPPVISPDGSHIAYVAEGRLWLLDLTQIEPREVASSDGARHPFWSPDGMWIGYGTSAKLWKASVSGGAPGSICDLPGGISAATWGADGTIVLAPNSGGLLQVSARGGDLVPFLEIDRENETDFHKPTHLPDGRGLVFGVHGVHGPIDTVAALGPDGQRKVLLTIEDGRLDHPVYSASTGHLLWARMVKNKGIWAAPFSLDRLELTGAPFLVAPEGNRPSVTRDGTLLYVAGSADRTRQLAWVDLQGDLIQPIGEPLDGVRMYLPQLSPDGNRVAVTAMDNENTDIWIHDVHRGTRTRYTFGEDLNVVSAWASGGDSLYYAKGTGWMSTSIFRGSGDGIGEAVRLADGIGARPSPDGKRILFSRFDTETEWDIWSLELDSEGAEPQPLARGAWAEGAPDLSRDGRYIAYHSDESGDNQIYLKRFPGGRGKWQVSTSGGVWPRWGHDGTKLIYSGDGKLWSVDIDTTDSPVIGAPEELFTARDKRIQLGFLRTYESGPDDRLLVVRSVGEEVDAPAVVLVDNWIAEFEPDR